MKKLKLFFILFTFLGFSKTLDAHSVQVAYCVSCNGDLRLFFEHWHGSEDPATTTMTISITINGVTTTQTAPPAGSVMGVAKGNLPGCSSQIITAAACPGDANTYNDWVWFDYTGLPLGVPITYTVVSGNTQFTEDGCGMYPLVINFTIPNSAGTFPDANVCNGTNVPLNSVFVGTTWTNDNTSIGLAASGSGDIPAFTAVNTSGVPVVANVTVTTLNSCLTSTTTYKITVNPAASPGVPPPVSICDGGTVPMSVFTSVSPTAVFDWTNNTTSIGLGASGTGNTIPSFTGTNSGTQPLIATVAVTLTENGCTGPPTNFIITVNPIPVMSALSNVSTCDLLTVAASNFTSPTGGATFSWTNNNTAIGLGASGNGDYPSFAATNPSTNAIVANISVTPTANTCAGVPSSFTITVNPNPTMNSLANIIVCDAQTIAATNFTSSFGAVSYTWTNDNTSIGIGASGSGNIASFTSSNVTAATTMANVSVTPTMGGCSGPPVNYTISVKPTPVLDPISNEAICHTAVFANSNFTSQTANTTFTWTNDNTSIGLAANGIGNINSFTANNPSTNPVIANIVLTPVALSCVGTPTTFTITVNPSPNVDPIADIVVCNTVGVPLTNFTSTTAGALFDWTNDDITIGILSSGSGNFNFTATNITTAPRVANISVFATANGCTGPAEQFTIRVNPTPTVNPLTSMVVCNSETVVISNFSSPTAGTTYTWGNSLTSIGLASNGTGDIPQFTGVNFTTTPATATIVVLPTANNCNGTPFPFTVTVNPTPRVDPLANITICNFEFIDTTNFTSITPGTTFTWTNDNTDIGLNSSGVGNVNGFYAENKSLTPIFATIVVTPTANNCVGITSDYIITVNPTPIVEFTPTTISVSELFPIVDFHNLTIGASSYFWQFGDELTSTEENPLHDYGNAPIGNYFVSLIATTPLGCIDTALATVKILEELIYYVPNTFTPDGNELNNTFQPVFTSGFETTNYSLTVFDRWGEMIFESHDTEVGWDGTYGEKSGKIVQDGMYIWKIEFTTSKNQEVKSLVGHVSIIR